MLHLTYISDRKMYVQSDTNSFVYNFQQCVHMLTYVTKHGPFHRHTTTHGLFKIGKKTQVMQDDLSHEMFFWGKNTHTKHVKLHMYVLSEQL